MIEREGGSQRPRGREGDGWWEREEDGQREMVGHLGVREGEGELKSDVEECDGGVR